MKKCTYCGKEYPDEVEVCERDSERLVDPNAPKPAPVAKPEQNLVGIGGWLLFLAVMVYLSLIGGLIGPIALIGFVVMLFNHLASFGELFFIAFSGLIYTGLYIWLWIAALRFRGKRSTFPSTMIKYLIANFIASVVMLVICIAWLVISRPAIRQRGAWCAYMD
jgi:uncharacterized membrane protein